MKLEHHHCSQRQAPVAVPELAWHYGRIAHPAPEALHCMFTVGYRFCLLRCIFVVLTVCFLLGVVVDWSSYNR
jgi:hypothetical protein